MPNGVMYYRVLRCLMKFNLYCLVQFLVIHFTNYRAYPMQLIRGIHRTGL